MNTRKNPQTPVNTTIDMHDGENSNNDHKTTKQDKTTQQSPQILSKHDIIIISAAALILSMLAAVIVVLLIFALNLSMLRLCSFYVFIPDHFILHYITKTHHILCRR